MAGALGEGADRGMSAGGHDQIALSDRGTARSPVVCRGSGADFLPVIPQTSTMVAITYRPDAHGALTRVPPGGGVKTSSLARFMGDSRKTPAS